MRRFDDRVRRMIDRIAAFGSHWVHMPPCQAARRRLGPPAGHPERLCPEMPPTALERRLARELGPLPENF